MKTKIQNLLTRAAFALALFLAFNHQLSTVHAQGTAFTYQGQLVSGGAPANGSYDLTFTLFDAGADGDLIAGPLTNSATAVSNGLFTVTLDFGAGVFTGTTYWLEIAVETNGGSGFTTLAPRQQVTPTPYAIFANTASNVLGTVSSAGLAGEYGNVVTLDNPGNSISGTFTGDGTGVANVDALTLDGLSSAAFWSTAGNAGADPANGAFLGTTDDLPLELHVNGSRALRLEYAYGGVYGVAPNVIGGSPGNAVSNGVFGAFIAGGSASYPNQVGGDFASVLGGLNNTASGFASTAAGSGSTASGNYSAIGGGAVNVAADPYSTVAGGKGNSIITLSGTNSTIGGGYANSISYTITGVLPFSFTSSSYSTIAGGRYNTIYGDDATIGGGFVNTANGSGVTVGGGVGNSVSGVDATVGGGLENTASGNWSTVPGGLSNSAKGDNSFAAGDKATANYASSFVWSDSTFGGFSDAKANQFLIQSSGGVGIGTSETPPGGLRVASGGLAVTGASSPNYGTAQGVFLEQGTSFIFPSFTDIGAVYAYDYADGHPLPLLLNSPGGNVGIGTTTPGALLQVGNGGAYCNGTTWVNGSDRNAKQDFAAVNPRTVLEKVSALPITEWKYKVEADGAEHIGPMAQDFHAAFGLNGADDKHISTVDEGGVALAAIQGLDQKLNEKNAEIQDLKRQNELLAKQLNQLESVVESIANRK